MRTVSDIMQTEIIGVRGDASIRDLVQTLDEEAISGVPVLDGSGEVQGVVSRTDIIRMAAHEAEIPMTEAFWEGVGRTDEEADGPDAYFLAPESAVTLLPGSGGFDGTAFEDLRVEEIMTPVAFTVEPAMSIEELARFLVQGRIHRALVVEAGRLVGIVSAFDVMRAVAEGDGAPSPEVLTGEVLP